jgi:putative sugar O-methyltransferase
VTVAGIVAPRISQPVGTHRYAMTDDPIPLADLHAEPGDPVLRAMLADYLAARDVPPPCDVGGHWGYFRRDFDRLIRTAAAWPRFRRLGISYGFDDSLKAGDGSEVPEAKPSFRRHGADTLTPWSFKEGMLRDDLGVMVRTARATLSPETIDRLGEAEIGDPPARRFADVSVPVDLHDLSMVHFAVRLERLLAEAPPTRTLEIGGGYGALAAKLHRCFPSTRSVIVDLPETGAVQHYYLSRALPSARIVGYAEFLDLGPKAALEVADVMLLPPAAIVDLPDGVADLAINIRSLPEMSRAYAAFYAGEIQRLLTASGTFYCVNALAKTLSGETVALADLPFDHRWRLDGSEPVPWQKHIRELVLRRTAEDGPAGDEGLPQALPQALRALEG